MDREMLVFDHSGEPVHRLGVHPGPPEQGVKISMDEKGRYSSDNIFVERMWRTVKYEEVHLRLTPTSRKP